MNDVCSAALIRGRRCEVCICAPYEEYDIEITSHDSEEREYSIKSEDKEVRNGSNT